MPEMTRKQAVDGAVARLRALVNSEARVEVYKGRPSSVDGVGTFSVVEGYSTETERRSRDAYKHGHQISVVDAIKRGPGDHEDIEDRMADMVAVTQRELMRMGLLNIQSTPFGDELIDGLTYRAEQTIATVPPFSMKVEV